MKSFIIKYLPIVVGAFIGMVIFWAPPFVSPYLGWWTYPVLVGAGLLLFFLTVLMAFAWSMPYNLESRPLVETDFPEEVKRAMAPFASLGFRQAGQAMFLKIGPGADLYPFLHNSLPVAISLSHLHTMPAKVSFDVLSVFSDEQGLLTTTGTVEAGAAPIPDGCYLQIFPNLVLKSLLEKHLRGLEWLQSEKGLKVETPTEDLFRSGLEFFLRKQRALFLRNPVGCALVAIRRSISATGPNFTPVWLQKSQANPSGGTR